MTSPFLPFYSGGLVKPAEVLFFQIIIFLFEAVTGVSAKPALPRTLVTPCCNPADSFSMRRDLTWAKVAQMADRGQESM